MTQSLFDSLSLPWQVAVTEAWLACLDGSLPIGSVLTDASGTIVARGHNLRLSLQEGLHPLAGSPVAHAEILTLGAIKQSCALREFSLYSTTEPCPMCAGAIRMAGVGQVHYASRDPFAGGMNLFSANNHYMRSHKFDVHGPDSDILEILLIALLVERLLHVWANKSANSVAAWSSISADAVQFGKSLSQHRIITRMLQDKLPAKRMLNTLDGLFRTHFPATPRA